MPDERRDPKVDDLLAQAKTWRAEYAALRHLILPLGLDETLKWGWPCYSVGGKNITLIHGFKDYCALLFFKGALMPDPAGLLIQQTKNVQAARQMRFRDLAEIEAQANLITDYVAEAMAVEAAGLAVPMKTTAEFEPPPELTERLAADADLKAAFAALTPGRQRAYILHFGSPKQAKTRTARIDKAAPQIMAGKGLND
jgi:uncharacterized protein YdeI (YjbR/CyaY-like superfamily)